MSSNDDIEREVDYRIQKKGLRIEDCHPHHRAMIRRDVERQRSEKVDGRTHTDWEVPVSRASHYS